MKLLYDPNGRKERKKKRENLSVITSEHNQLPKQPERRNGPLSRPPQVTATSFSITLLALLGCSILLENNYQGTNQEGLNVPLNTT